jgi:hypothetical protein
MPAAGFETAVPAIKRLQAYTFDGMGNGIGTNILILTEYIRNDKQQRLWRI